jgi:dolichol-phosphate mannosyltransferase
MYEVLIIIPTYNESDNVKDIASEVLKTKPDADILFVDDNSPDETGKIIDNMAKSDNRIHIIHRSDKNGLGRAYISGFKWALNHEYKYIFEMDADFSHNPREIPNFLKSMNRADLILGSRYCNGIRIINWPLNRLILSKTASLYVRILTGMPFTDPTGGYKCYSRKVLESINLEEIKSNGYSFQIETTYHAWKKGFRIIEIPIVFEDRRSGNSKMNFKIIREALFIVLKLRFSFLKHKQR